MKRAYYSAVALAMLTCSVAMLYGSQAQAAIVYQTRTTLLSVSSYPCFCGVEYHDEASTTTLDAYQNTISVPSAEASQSSILSAQGISVNTSLITQGFDGGYARSLLAVEFLLTTPMTYTFTGRAAHYYDAGLATIELTGNGVRIAAQEDWDTTPSMTTYSLNASGLLNPGVYRFFMDAVSAGPRSPAHTYAVAQLNLSPVPLPAALWLLLSGLLPLMRFKRRG